LLTVHKQFVPVIFGAELVERDGSCALKCDCAALPVSISIWEIRACDTGTAWSACLCARTFKFPRPRHGSRRGRCWRRRWRRTRHGISVVTDITWHNKVGGDASCKFEAAFFSPICTPGIHTSPVGGSPACDRNSMIRRLATRLAIVEDTIVVGEEGVCHLHCYWHRA